MNIRNLILPLIVAAISLLMPTVASAQSERSTLGAKVGYISKNESMMVGAFFQYRLTGGLRIAPELGMVLRNDNLDAFNMDVNLHFPLSVGSTQCNIYPLIGVDYASWGIHDLHSIEHGIVSKSVSKFGLNLGAGFEYFAKRNFKLRVEWKYTLTSKYSNTVADFGVGYMF